MGLQLGQQLYTGVQDDVTAAAKLTLPGPIRVTRVGFVTSTATATNPLKITASLAGPNGGSPSVVATITAPAAIIAAGTVLHGQLAKDLAPLTSPPSIGQVDRAPSPNGLIVRADQTIVIASIATAPTAGAGFYFVEFYPLPFVPPHIVAAAASNLEVTPT